MSVSCECCVLSGRGICVGLITHPEESSECGVSDRKASTKRRPWPTRCSKVWSRYRPGVAQRVGRGISLLFYDHGTRMGWVVSSTPRPHFTPGKDQVPILQEAGWGPGPVWTGGKSHPHRDSIPNRPARSQSLCRLSYPAHTRCSGAIKILYVSFEHWIYCVWTLSIRTYCPACTVM